MLMDNTIDHTVDPSSPLSADLENKQRLSMMLLTKWVVGFLFFAYVLIRVFTVDLANDEITIGRPIVGNIIFDWVDAQVHFLADIFLTLSTRYLPLDTVTAVRFPSLISFVLYLYAIAWISSLVRPRWLECLCFTAFAANAFMLDFFGLGRGYSISLAFGMLSLRFFFDRFSSSDGTLSGPMAYLCIWSASLAVLSNLAFLHFYIALGAILVFMSIDLPTLRGTTSLKNLAHIAGRVLRTNGYIFANAAIIAVFYLPRVIRLVQGKKLYAGGTEGFIVDTVGSLVADTLYDIHASESLTRTLAFILVGMWAAISLRLIYNLARGDRHDTSASRAIALVFSSLLALSALIAIVLHHVAGVRFLVSRTALIFFPLFMGQVVFFAASETKAYLKVPALIFTSVVIGIFLCNANLTHTDTWKMNSRTRQLFRDMTAAHDQLGREIVLGVSDAHKPKLTDYMRIMDIKWLKWYSIDMYHRFNGQYQIHPQTDYFYLWHNHGKMPPGLEWLPIEPFGGDYSLAESVLYKVRDDANLGEYLKPVQQP
jgi:hypothetical protein